MKCPLGKEGLYFDIDCNCAHGTCDERTGTCLCLPGWTGKNCDKICNPGYYEVKCSNICFTYGLGKYIKEIFNSPMNFKYLQADLSNAINKKVVIFVTT